MPILRIGPVTPTPRYEHRLGRFRFNGEVLRGRWSEIISGQIFGRFVVIEARTRIEYDCIEYLAFSDLFDPLEEGMMAPLYDVLISRELVHGSPMFSVSAKRSELQPDPNYD